jgi:alginate O-acetyltransferase complex protein AlgI
MIKGWFLYKKGEPILFTQLYFWGFFSVVLLVFSLVHKVNILRTIFLLAVSFFFYYKTSGIFLILLIFTICSDYLWGHLIYKSEKQSHKRIFLTISLVFNLFLLGYFKYAYFFTESYNELMHTHYPFFNHFAQFSNGFFGTDFNLGKLILPAGISFFTFQSISYVMDMYRAKITPVRNIFDYGFFVCFFPHLVAGPIVKANEFIHQIYQPYNLSRTEFGLAVFWILNGLGKKILADYVAVNFIDRVFQSTDLYSGFECILAIFAYSFQVYADFSGYTDIAIGVALLMGFRLKTNFKSPYKAASVSEFWQRWHISLSSWLKEYLYIPLGGNRQGTIGSYIVITFMCGIVIMLSGDAWLPVLITLLMIALILFVLGLFFSGIRKAINTNINLMITMLLGGLWHGSSWMFITWGGLNGLGLVIHKIWHKINPMKAISETWYYNTIMIFVTLTFISFTRIWFRVGSMPGGNWEKVKSFFDRMQNHMGMDKWWDILSGYQNIMIAVALGYIIHWFPENLKEKYRLGFAEMPLPAIGIFVIGIVFCLYQLMSAEMQPFIYFQF